MLLAMGVPIERAIGSLRMSLWPHISDADIDYVVAQLPGVIAAVRAGAVPAI